MNREEVEKFLLDAGWKLQANGLHTKIVDGREYAVYLMKTICKVKVLSKDNKNWIVIGGKVFKDCKIIPPAQGHNIPVLTIGTIKIIGASL